MQNQIVRISMLRMALVLAIAAVTMGLVLALQFKTARAAPTASQQVYAVTKNNRLVSFKAAKSCKLVADYAITGMQPGEKMLGIDFRPATAALYGIGSTSRLYTIDTGSGAATIVGSGPITTALASDNIGFDFNPTVDRIRLVTDSGQNLRLHPDTAAVAFIDTSLAYGGADVNAGATPDVVGAGYTNPDVITTTATVLYDIDATLDILVSQNPPNSGTLNTIGALGVNAKSNSGFDISLNDAYLIVTPSKDPGGNCGASQLYTVNLGTGSASFLGAIGTAKPIRAMAVVP